MLRVRTKHRRPRFFRGGVEFGRGWLTLTEPGDPVEQPDVNKKQAQAIRAEKRFLEVEDVPEEEAKKILDPQPDNNKKQGAGGSANSSGKGNPGSSEPGASSKKKAGEEKAGKK